MSDPTASHERFTKLEILCMQLQQDVAAIHSVVLAQQKEIDQLRRNIARLESMIEVSDDHTSLRDPLAEKPPHY